MAMEDFDGTDLMGDSSTMPGGAQERFIMSLLGNAAGKKGYQALQLPFLALLLKDQMQGFDQQRAKQAQVAQAMKLMQFQQAAQKAAHEQQKMQAEQEQLAQGGILSRLMSGGVNMPTEGPATAEGVGPAPVQRQANPAEILSQAIKAGPQGMTAAKEFLDLSQRRDPLEMMKQLMALEQPGGAPGAPAEGGGIQPFRGGLQFDPSVSGKGDISFSGSRRTFDPATTEALRVITGQGIPQNDPRLPALVSEYIAAKALVGAEAQNLAFQNLQGKIAGIKAQQQGGGAPGITPTPGAAPGMAAAPSGGGGTFLDQVRDIQVKTADALARAREQAQREESRLTENISRRISGYRELEGGIKEVANLWEQNPGAVGWVGKGILPFQDKWDEILADETAKANKARRDKTEYEGGAIIGRMREFMGTVSPGQAEFYRRVLFLQDQLLRAQSGQQTAEQEAGRLARLVPRATDEPTVFLEKLAGLAKQSNTTVTDLLETATMSPKEQLERRRREGPVRTPQLGKSAPPIAPKPNQPQKLEILELRPKAR